MYTMNGEVFYLSDIGQTVFLTTEDAEKVLKKEK